ncbi:MAG: ROK family protein [Demequinaceae bacterium]|nr:ROK family protein [Demequinaceae bacterium]
MRLGVDIGGTKTDVVAVEGGVIVARHRAGSGQGADAVVASTLTAVEALMARASITWADVESVGVGIPGSVVDGVVSYALNLGIDRLDLAGELERAWDLRPVVDNDVNAAALGAWALRKGGSSLAYLNLGTGLASGLILDGKLWRGSRGAAGEIGHISIDPGGPVDADGLPGAIEVYASGGGLVRQWGVEGAAARDVLDAADAGDPRAQEIRDRLFYGLASAVRVLVLTLDVESIVVGGGLTGRGQALVDGAARVIEGWAASSSFLASLDLAGRMSLLDPDIPVAALGAAALGETGLSGAGVGERRG